jgi:hypothetical protein
VSSHLACLRAITVHSKTMPAPEVWSSKAVHGQPIWSVGTSLSAEQVPCSVQNNRSTSTGQQTKAVTIVSKGTDYEENIPCTTRDKELTCARDVINGHSTLRHHAPPTAVEHLARSGPCRFLWRVWGRSNMPKHPLDHFFMKNMAPPRYVCFF